MSSIARNRDPIEIMGGPRVVSVAYMALTHEDDVDTANAEWRDWYSFLPWEDWRNGRPALIDDEIRPAVAMDGGDIIFAGFRDGVVELYMQGACQGCPSSTLTLKMGIEQRLREAVPEVRTVEAI